KRNDDLGTAQRKARARRASSAAPIPRAFSCAARAVANLGGTSRALTPTADSDSIGLRVSPCRALGGPTRLLARNATAQRFNREGLHMRLRTGLLISVAVGLGQPALAEVSVTRGPSPIP